MTDRIKEMIADLEHRLEHAESEHKTSIQNARIQLEAQIANLDGRLTQKIEDMKEEKIRLKALLSEEAPE